MKYCADKKDMQKCAYEGKMDSKYAKFVPDGQIQNSLKKGKLSGCMGKGSYK